MPTPPSPTDSIERFAELVAHLVDGFADRTAVLRAAGLTQASWTQIEGRWMERLASTEGGELARRFGDAYAAARARLLRPTLASGAEETRDTHFLVEEAQPLQEAAAGRDVGAEPPHLLAPPAVGGVAPPSRATPPAAPASGLDRTAETSFAPILASLPFAARGEGATAGAPTEPQPMPSRAAPHPLDATIEAPTALSHPPLPFGVPCEGQRPPAAHGPGLAQPRATASGLGATLDGPTALPVTALPFTSATTPPAHAPVSPPDLPVTGKLGDTLRSAQATPAAVPGKRLLRFDPQTGRQLPAPIWVDIPESTPSKR
jgi:hypothetical protein